MPVIQGPVDATLSYWSDLPYPGFRANTMRRPHVVGVSASGISITRREGETGVPQPDHVGLETEDQVSTHHLDITGECRAEKIGRNGM